MYTACIIRRNILFELKRGHFRQSTKAIAGARQTDGQLGAPPVEPLLTGPISVGLIYDGDLTIMTEHTYVYACEGSEFESPNGSATSHATRLVSCKSRDWLVNVNGTPLANKDS